MEPCWEQEDSQLLPSSCVRYAGLKLPQLTLSPEPWAVTVPLRSISCLPWRVVLQWLMSSGILPDLGVSMLISGALHYYSALTKQRTVNGNRNIVQMRLAFLSSVAELYVSSLWL